jgi:AraC-like DNA-binding protein
LLKSWEILKQLNQMVFSISLVGHQQCEPSWHKPPRQHTSHSLWLISKGRGEFVVNGSNYVATPGKLFVIVPGMVYERWADPRDPLEYYFVRFTYASAYEDSEKWHHNDSSEVEFPLSGMYQIQNPPEIINIFDQLNHLWQRRGPRVTMRRNIAFQELLLAITDDFRSQKVAGNTTLAIETTINYIVSHYKKKLTLEDLAKLAGLSVSHYSRLFKKYAGHSPIDYLTHLRMDRAKELLVLSDYRLKGIAESVGYEDEFYFSRIFKKVVGISPTEFVKKYKITQKK